MSPALVFFGVATLVGCLVLAVVAQRLRAAARQGVPDEESCELRQAKKISTAAVVVSLAGLAVAGVAYVVVDA